jgi:hypothetical protein
LTPRPGIREHYLPEAEVAGQQAYSISTISES